MHDTRACSPAQALSAEPIRHSERKNCIGLDGWSQYSAVLPMGTPVSSLVPGLEYGLQFTVPTAHGAVCG